MTAIVKGSIWRRKHNDAGDWLLFAIWPTGEVTLLAEQGGTLVISAEKLEAEWRCVRLS